MSAGRGRWRLGSRGGVWPCNKGVVALGSLSASGRVVATPDFMDARVQLGSVGAQWHCLLLLLLLLATSFTGSNCRYLEERSIAVDVSATCFDTYVLPSRELTVTILKGCLAVILTAWGATSCSGPLTGPKRTPRSR